MSLYECFSLVLHKYTLHNIKKRPTTKAITPTPEGGGGGGVLGNMKCKAPSTNFIGLSLQIVLKAGLGDVAASPCSDPVAFPAGDSQTFLEGVFVMAWAFPILPLMVQ